MSRQPVGGLRRKVHRLRDRLEITQDPTRPERLIAKIKKIRPTAAVPEL